jgi:hypothetical protein
MSCHFFKGERPRPAGCVTHLAEHSSPLIFQFFVLKIECLTYFKLLPPAKAETTPQELSIVNKFRNHSHPTGRLCLERKNGLVLS